MLAPVDSYDLCQAWVGPGDPGVRYRHELGHAYHNHDCSTPDNEREADEWAANQLLDDGLVEEAAWECDSEPVAMAAELGVTVHLLRTWERLYRVGRTRHVSACGLSLK